MYRTEDSARRAAQSISLTDKRFHNEILFVVWEEPEYGYELATQIDLDTYFAGIEPIAAYRNGEDVS